MPFVSGVQFLQFPSPLSKRGHTPHIPQTPESQSLSVKASNAKKAIIQLFNQVAHLFFWQLRCMRHLELGANLGFSTVSRWFSLWMCSLILKRISRDTRSLLLILNTPIVGKYVSQNNMLIQNESYWCVHTSLPILKAVPCSTARIHALSHKHFHLEETNTTQQP